MTLPKIMDPHRPEVANRDYVSSPEYRATSIKAAPDSTSTAACLPVSVGARHQCRNQSLLIVRQVIRVAQLAAVITGGILCRPHRRNSFESGHRYGMTKESTDSISLRIDNQDWHHLYL